MHVHIFSSHFRLKNGIQNMQTSQGRIFRILQHFVTKFCNFTSNFNKFFTGIYFFFLGLDKNQSNMQVVYCLLKISNHKNPSGIKLLNEYHRQPSKMCIHLKIRIKFVSICYQAIYLCSSLCMQIPMFTSLYFHIVQDNIIPHNELVQSEN